MIEFAMEIPEFDRYITFMLDKDKRIHNISKIMIYSSFFQPSTATLAVYANGLRELLKYVKERYGDPEIIIAENGIAK